MEGFSIRYRIGYEDVGLKGQILRAELLQNKMTPKPHYIGVFYGVQFVSIVNEWSLHIKKRNEFNSNLSFDPSPKC